MGWGDKGSFYYRVQNKVGGVEKRRGLSRQEDDVLSRLRFGHTRLNDTLKLMGKHPTGECEDCGECENVEHVLIRCGKYSHQRRELIRRMEGRGVTFSLLTILKGGRDLDKDVIKFLRDTGLIRRV